MGDNRYRASAHPQRSCIRHAHRNHSRRQAIVKSEKEAHLVIQSLAALGTNRIIELIGTIRTESIVRADTIDRHHLLNKERLHELALAVETDKVSLRRIARKRKRTTGW